jgi:hypothetical protein
MQGTRCEHWPFHGSFRVRARRSVKEDSRRAGEVNGGWAGEGRGWTPGTSTHRKSQLVYLCVNMRLVLLAEGWSFSVFAIDRSPDPDRPDCPAVEYLEALERDARKALTNRIQVHAARGPLKNIQQSRPLGDGIFEFKSRLGHRMLYFYDPVERRRTLLTHGFSKGSVVNAEKATAVRMRSDWVAQQGKQR